MAEQVVDGVWLLDLGLMPPLASNAYLVDDTRGQLGGRADGGNGPTGADDRDEDAAGADRADGAGSEAGVTLVDAGLRWNLSSVRDELATAGYTVGDIDRVLLTHYDLDHTWGLDGIAAELSAPVYIGAADGALVRGEADPPLLHHKGLFHRVARRIAPIPENLTVTSVEEGDRIGRFTAYHTPGHNPGHTVYVHDDGVAFLGDLVWEEEGAFTPPIWFDSYDMAEIHRSIQAFVDRSPDFETACMGHGDPLVGDASATLRQLAGTLTN